MTMVAADDLAVLLSLGPFSVTGDNSVIVPQGNAGRGFGNCVGMCYPIRDPKTDGVILASTMAELIAQLLNEEMQRRRGLSETS
jgi:hypothetical protein